MSSINYNYVFLSDSDVINNQSRGLSLQFNGYALLSGSDDAISSLIEAGRVLSMSDIINAGVTVMFRDLQYTTSNQIAKTSDRKYERAVENPGPHMFQDLKVMAADEYKVEDTTGYSSGQTEIEVPIYDTMFGNRLTGEAKIIGVILYGQAYNRDFYSEVQQGDLENSVPIGLISFGSDSDVTVDPTSGSSSKDKSIIRLLLGINAGHDVTDMVNSGEAYRAWSAFRGTMHVVNENLLTTSSFVVHDHDVVPIDDKNIEVDNADGGAVLNKAPTIDIKSRLFFTSDVPGSDNYDHNVDYGSPARLTVLTSDDPASERRPQTMLGKVSYYSDNNSYKHAYIDGVVESYFTSSGKSAVGSVFDFDWVSKERPAFNLFSDDTSYHFEDDKWGDYLIDEISESDAYEQIRSNSACFARGVNLFSERSQSVDGININCSDVKARGNAFCINSNRCTVFTRAPTEDEVSNRYNANKYTAFVANSHDVTIRDRVKGVNSTVGKNNPLNTVLNSTFISIDNTSPGLALANTEKYGRNTVIGSHNLSVNNADDNLFLGIKGYTYYSKNKEKCVWSIVENTKSSIFAGGYVKSNMAKHCVILSTTGDSQDKPNAIEGYLDESSSNPNSTACYIYDSFILGQNNKISSIFEYKPWESGNTGVKYSHDEHQVFLVGKGLKNDIRQTMENLNSGNLTPTIIAGINNQDYYLPNQMKQIVIGGFRPNTSAYYEGNFHYNCAELAVTYPNPQYRNGQQNWNKETCFTLKDVKGRSVDYGSGSITLGFLKGKRSDRALSENSYKGCGRINLFKLYQLLKRMYWAQSGDDYVVKWKRGMTSDRFGGILEWSDFGMNQSDTCLANLVDDSLCQYQFFPEKGEGN